MGVQRPIRCYYPLLLFVFGSLPCIEMLRFIPVAILGWRFIGGEDPELVVILVGTFGVKRLIHVLTQGKSPHDEGSKVSVPGSWLGVSAADAPL